MTKVSTYKHKISQTTNFIISIFSAVIQSITADSEQIVGGIVGDVQAADVAITEQTDAAEHTVMNDIKENASDAVVEVAHDAKDKVVEVAGDAADAAKAVASKIGGLFGSSEKTDLSTPVLAVENVVSEQTTPNSDAQPDDIVVKEEVAVVEQNQSSEVSWQSPE